MPPSPLAHRPILSPGPRFCSLCGREGVRGQLRASAARSRVCLLGEIFQGPNGPDSIRAELQKPYGVQDLVPARWLMFSFLPLCAR